jgi:hypothetical protein
VKAAKKQRPNCWEFLGCPEETYRNCPAYPMFGRECWRLTGTKCASGGIELTTLDEKLGYCWKECQFYKAHGKE